ncbi:RHS repeat-associated protein [Rheinheimera pacifica]|uniref:toxin TcdB middle/N-terminal domain-containing protein n=1 Tax=Rheinheimera pacifica TaxID=173990 RepID=UPI002864E3EF|nr:toxin TcdB middle/N-terminal domain-containing protein [Rheinheimera pacifica]MDR6985125.1 RHS repeat-associated protein [Rheinheimera pacifica]
MRAVVRLMLFSILVLAGFTAAAQSGGYKIYTDYGGGIYIEAPKKFVLIHGDVSVPLSLTPPNGLMRLYQGFAGWQVEYLTEDQWRALQLQQGHASVRQLSYADYTGNGAGDLRVLFHESNLPVLTLSNLDSNATVSAVGGSVYDPIEPLPPLLGAGSVVGLTAGEFRVDESGAATYQIPLSLPAGIAGVQPQLAFSYNSSGGDGYMGAGWSFAGASAVTRCPKNIEVDGVQGNVAFAESDRLCLDGQRLVTNDRENDKGVNDSTYWNNNTVLHTETDNFSTVRRHGSSAQGPLALTVETKSGEIYYYGDITAVSGNDTMINSLAVTVRNVSGGVETGSDAFFDTASGSGTARLWALKATKDTKGNYIVYKYQKDVEKGEHYLTEVHYTGRVGGAAPFVKVQLNYANNPKRASGWQAGSRVLMSKLLSSVSVYLDGAEDANVVRHYQLNYVSSNVLEEKNHLVSVQECADKALQQCLPATTFDWQKPAAITTTYQTRCETEPGAPHFCWEEPVTENFVPFLTTSELKGSSFDRQNQQLIDINGDGYVDMLYVRSSQWKLRLGGTNNYATEIGLTSVGINKKQYAQSIDYNGDGQRDLLVADSATSNWHIVTYIPSTTTGMTCEPTPVGRRLCETYTIQLNHTVINTNRVAHGLEGGAFVADIDGDGLEDIVFVRGGHFRWYQNLGRMVNGSPFSEESELGPVGESSSGVFDMYPDYFTADMKSASMVDVNGDGKTDLIIRVNQTVWEPDPGSGCQIQIQSEPVYSALSADASPTSACGRWETTTSVKLFTSTGTALVEKQNLGNIADVRAVDLNGDGYTDLMYRSNTRWYYQLSNGKQLLPARQAGLPAVANNLLGLTYFIDINGDGRTDVLLPSSSSNWGIYLSRPSDANEQVLFERRGNRTFDSNAAIQFADINADGKLDLLTSVNDSGWKVFHSVRPHINEYAINKITNGWGVVTDIEYKNITNKSVYFRDVSSNNSSSDFFSPRAGMYVVSKVSSEVNPAKKVSVTYQYGGLLVHKKGRGMLGFEVLRTKDEQTNVITETVYNQLWPYTGIPKTTTQVITVNGTEQVLSFAKNTVAKRTTAQGGVYPYISASEEHSYQLGSDNQHYALAKTTSSFSYDSYGNLLNNTVVQSDANNASQMLTISTVNGYGASVIAQRYGRLATTKVTKTQGSQSTVRESKFDYYDRTGGLLLKTEILAPNDSAQRVTTQYSYDAAGNITRKAVTAGTNASGSVTATRNSDSIYDARFRYLKESINHLGFKTVYTYNGLSADTVTGRINYVNTVDANNQTNRQYVNALGQSYRSYIKGHSSSDPVINSYTERQYCTQVSGGCGVTGAYARIRQYADGGGEQLQFLDKYGRDIESRSKLLTGSWSVSRTAYDALGRPEYSYEPGIGAASAHASRVEYDTMGRAYKTHLASGGVSETSYRGFLTITTDPQGKIQQTLTNYLGQTQQVKDHLNNILDYSYDSFGNLETVYAQSMAGVRSLRTQNYYDAYGRKYRMADQDKGTWNYSYNAFGELLSQTDAKSQTTSFDYDSAGRMTRRYDPSGTSCWNYGDSLASYNRGQLTRVRSFGANQQCTTTATPDYEELYSYNSRALPAGKLTRTAGSSFSVSSSYDSFNRLHLLTYPSWTLNPADDLVVKHEYQHGSLVKLADNNSNRVYQHIQAVNARGQATKVTYANGVTEDRSFYAGSGWLDTLTVKRGSTHVHNMDYNYDYVGNVTQRQLNFGGVGSQAGFTEVFGYDDLHRVTSRTISAVSGSNGYNNLPAALKMDETYRYDHFGNMTFKAGVGNYCYDGSKTNRLLAVGATTSCGGTGAYTFGYDNNGNVTTDGKRSFTYTAFDKPGRIVQGADRTDFAYGPNRELYRRIDVRANKTTDTLYIGGLYERISLPSTVTEHKFYVGNAVITKRSNNAHDEYYLHKDGQGSTTSITNAAGSLLQQFIYDPWGKQYSVATNSLFNTYSNPGDSKGYTGHNMVNDFDVIHMGGRTYNPILGRFMQADPFIQAPSNLQNYNRYSYVLNNPMSYTDPSGYIAKKLYKGVLKATGVYAAQKFLLKNPLLNAIAQIAVAYYGGPLASAMFNFEQSFVATGSLRSATKSAAISYASSYALQGIGESSYWGQAGTPQNIFANAMVGGVTADLQGGKFGHGFVSAGIVSAFKPMLNDIGGGNSANAAIERGDLAALEMYKPYRIAGAAIIGGTASVISGGKFANGAITSAFTQLYNAESQSEKRARLNNIINRVTRGIDQAAKGNDIITISGSVKQVDAALSSSRARNELLDMIQLMDMGQLMLIDPQANQYGPLSLARNTVSLNFNNYYADMHRTGIALMNLGTDAAVIVSVGMLPVSVGRFLFAMEMGGLAYDLSSKKN